MSFLRFWCSALVQSFGFGWLVFGIVSSILPSLISLLQRHWRYAASLPWAKWVAKYQAELQVGIALFVVAIYLVYAPYRLYEELQVRAAACVASQEITTKLQKELVSNRELLAAYQLENSSLNRRLFDSDPSVAAFKKRASPIIDELLQRSAQWSHELLSSADDWNVPFAERVARTHEWHRKFDSEYKREFQLRVLALVTRLEEFGIDIKDLRSEAENPTNPLGAAKLASDLQQGIDRLK